MCHFYHFYHFHNSFACSNCHHLSQIYVCQFYHTLFHHQHDHEEAFAKRKSSSFYMVVENDFLATRVLCKDNFLHTSFSSFSIITTSSSLISSFLIIKIEDFEASVIISAIFVTLKFINILKQINKYVLKIYLL